MCAGMIDLKKAMTRITELEEELKATSEDEEPKETKTKNPRRFARRTTSSSTTPTLT